ncbi:hypothetical protein CRG98_018225 [Punica granatum]|uniref:HMA domain-containing protein n=1 Tax=Punica granatum TaxID=22663 RepID=A0A2I0JYG0_PUNGR|nr:hypothetical protein CRG98_018225 [Punica granatum]
MCGAVLLYCFCFCVISGVYRVMIDAENQKVTVSGSVDPAALIKKLVKAGKHAELWGAKPGQTQKQKNNFLKDDKNSSSSKAQKHGLIKALEEELDCLNDVQVDGDEEDEEMRLLRARANHLGFLRPGNMKKPGGGNVPQGLNNAKMVNHLANGNMGKKVNPSNPNAGIDLKAMGAQKVNNIGEFRRPNEMNSVLGLGGLGDQQLSGFGGFQIQPNNNGNNINGFLQNGFYSGGQFPPSMLMGMNGNHPIHQLGGPSGMMNVQGRQLFQQPQMMYQMSPYVPPNTGFYYDQYYDYGHSPYSTYSEPSYGNPSGDTAAHMFSGEDTVGITYPQPFRWPNHLFRLQIPLTYENQSMDYTARGSPMCPARPWEPQLLQMLELIGMEGDTEARVFKADFLRTKG